MLASKAQNCEVLELNNLLLTSADNRKMLIEIATIICALSEDLKELVLVGTQSTPEQGDEILQNLCDSGIRSFEKISFSGCRNIMGKVFPNTWFEGRPETFDKLLTIMKRQPRIKVLDLLECNLTEEQQEGLRSALAGTGCEISFD